ncbi:MAG: PQQ-binding-like beta-propeller repeat protein [Planctomycetota bacterium]
MNHTRLMTTLPAVLLLVGCGQKSDLPRRVDSAQEGYPARRKSESKQVASQATRPSPAASPVARTPAPEGNPAETDRATAATVGEAARALRQWPAWRGPLGTGVAPHADPPVEWSEGRNVRWKVALPGRGHSTPIVWGERVFVTTAIPHDGPAVPADRFPGAHGNLMRVRRHEFVVLALDRRDGKIIWQRTVGQDVPREGRHATGSFASNSPVTDGESLFAYFGSHGLYCLDLNGEQRWETDLGDMRAKHGHGEGSSPALHGETLVVNWDHEGRSFVIAFDKRTGKQRWKVARDEGTSWSTPVVFEHGGAAQVIISATKRIRGYDLATGEVIWECGGLSRNVVASPVAADGMVYAGSSYGIRAMLAIRLDGARGDIAGTGRVAWTLEECTPYVPSPLLYEDRLYFLCHYQGIITCLEARTGESLYGPVRLPGIRNVYASPVGAAGRVYVTDLDGTTLVLGHGAAPEVLAENRLDDSFSASPVAVGGELLLRGARHLYCIEEE